MRLVSFNINGLRARLHQLEALIAIHQPDLIGLQETKVHDDEFPREAVEAMGYHVYFHGQKGHYGVAILTRQAPEEVVHGFPDDEEDAQRRWIGARIKGEDGQPVWVYNGYFPQGENISHPTKFPHKRAFYAQLQRLLSERHSPEERLAVMGDFNISPQDIDIGIGEDNRKRWLREGKCCFLPEERAWLSQLSEWGLGDTFEHVSPQDGEHRYSWFDYRSKGFEREPRRGLRIDLILATAPLLSRLKGAGVDHVTRAMERPSDHAPTWAEFDLKN